MPSPDSYKGWEAYTIANSLVTIHLLPQLGGRIMQLTLDNYGFFFVNPALEGVEPNESRLGENGAWLNFGGEKIWPAPQGWGSPEAWPGPPDPVLDSGVFTVLSTDEPQPNRLTLVSPVDPYTGLQLAKAISLTENRSEVVVDATFTNQSTTPRAWSVWPVLQLNTPGFEEEGRYQVTSPINPDSRFEDGFRVLHGLANNPQFTRDESGNLVVNYQYLVGKVGLDSAGNWVAFCDQKTGKVLVASAPYDPQATYPENTSVQVWTQGRGQIYSRQQLNDFPNDPARNPPYLELELLSPLQTISPGGQIQFTYRMRTCTIPAGSSVKTATEVGVVAKPLHAFFEGDSVRMTGQFGVFARGQLHLAFIDETGQSIQPLSGFYHWKAEPQTGFVLDFLLPAERLSSAENVRILLHFEAEDTALSGELSHTILCRV
ncbi:DUF4380 domain-containing protein [Larkinella harenae]